MLKNVLAYIYVVTVQMVIILYVSTKKIHCGPANPQKTNEDMKSGNLQINLLYPYKLVSCHNQVLSTKYHTLFRNAGQAERERERVFSLISLACMYVCV